MYFWDIPPVLHLCPPGSHRILGLTRSSCIQLYLAVSRCISPYLTTSKTGYGQKYTPGEGYACECFLRPCAHARLCTSIDSPCECEHNNPDLLDARLFPSVVLAVAPAVTMDEASSLSTCCFTTPWPRGRRVWHVCMFVCAWPGTSWIWCEVRARRT